MPPDAKDARCCAFFQAARQFQGSVTRTFGFTTCRPRLRRHVADVLRPARAHAGRRATIARPLQPPELILIATRTIARPCRPTNRRTAVGRRDALGPQAFRCSDGAGAAPALATSYGGGRVVEVGPGLDGDEAVDCSGGTRGSPGSSTPRPLPDQRSARPDVRGPPSVSLAFYDAAETAGNAGRRHHDVRRPSGRRPRPQNGAGACDGRRPRMQIRSRSSQTGGHGDRLAVWRAPSCQAFFVAHPCHPDSIVRRAPTRCGASARRCGPWHVIRVFHHRGRAVRRATIPSRPLPRRRSGCAGGERRRPFAS